MPDNFKEAISRANQNFIDIVLPEVKKVLTGEFIIVENVMNNDIANILDQQSGVDALYVNDSGIRGVAIRIQYGQAWDTFTIRKSRESGARTEYLKRKESIEKNYLYPYFTIQSYIKNGILLSLAIARTEDLIDYIIKDHAYIRDTGPTQIGRASFYVVDWDNFKEKGYKIYIKR